MKTPGEIDVQARRARIARRTRGVGLLAALLMTTGLFACGRPSASGGEESSSVALGVTSIAVGGFEACALLSGGGVKCWGLAIYDMPLENSINPKRYQPVEIEGLGSGVSSLSLSGIHGCVVVGGAVKCWGFNGRGQLGDGTTILRLAPVATEGLSSGMRTVHSGIDSTCALSQTGGVKCWGFAAAGALGDGGDGVSSAPMMGPVDVSGLSSGVVAVSVGQLFGCALLSGGGVKCWGKNSEGQLGNGAPFVPGGSTPAAQLKPVDVVGLSSGVVAISAGSKHVCALSSSGGVLCWGGNEYGQLGRGAVGHWSSTPFAVKSLESGVSAIAAGGLNTCALTTGGGVKCWGYGGDGRLGQGPAASSATPVDITGLDSGVAAVAVGNVSCALMSSGAVRCWGDNTFGSLGDGTTIKRLTPVDVSGLPVSPVP
jgi:alpha-tubulin suppressor-like RCC1 family protein